MFGYGVGVQFDERRAADLFLKACDGGEIKGCFYAGLAFSPATVFQSITPARRSYS